MPSGPHCPVCGTARPRRIVYGLPTADVLGDDGVVLGGCVVSSDAWRWRCRNAACAREYGRLDR